MDSKVLEIIPINHEYGDHENSVLVHFARLRDLTIRKKQVDDIIYILFNEEEATKTVNILKGSLKIISQITPKEFEFTLSYPQIIRNIRFLRQKLESHYAGWQVYLNLSSLKFHLHAFLLRDGLKSTDYELFPYEIFDYKYETSGNTVIIPDYRELDLVDLEIIDLFHEGKYKPMNLKQFIRSLEAPGWDTTISTYSQKLRKRLNQLVKKGLLGYELGPNGEKFYSLKKLKLDDVKSEG